MNIRTCLVTGIDSKFDFLAIDLLIMHFLNIYIQWYMIIKYGLYMFFITFSIHVKYHEHNAECEKRKWKEYACDFVDYIGSFNELPLNCGSIT